ncbi:LysE family translocator [Xenorhabdus miraniensis]|uniref:CmaU protein n=1 Tax=Xenorhabdus miraniensis TaxID=351674 RepID=A0A2D0JJP7_9GAMM|nr:LysE family transporter [Xenorhabdus miraniensis]PHM46533.1 cmaU protein [Xenorhabdus miraniensis]
MILVNSTLTMITGISFVLLIPGPTNTLLLVSGLKNGVVKASPLIIAEVFGYITAIGIWGISLSTIPKGVHWIPEIIKVLCSFYIFYLATKVWSYGRTSYYEHKISFLQMVLASALNPKAILFVSLFIPKYSFDSINEFAFFILLFIMIVIPIGFLWISLGGAIRKQSSKNLLFIIYRIASVILMVFSCILFLSLLE